MAAPLKNAILQFSRLSIRNSRQFVTQSGPLAFHASQTLWSEPMKKKKRKDPAVAMERERKKRRRLEKHIKKLESKGRNLKPCEEIEGDLNVMKTAGSRQREAFALTTEEAERQVLLMKDWHRFKFHQHRLEIGSITNAVAAQQKALSELRKESEELYQQAIQMDDNLIPFKARGPVQTPPIEGYDAPDGEYVDITKTYDTEITLESVTKKL